MHKKSHISLPLLMGDVLLLNISFFLMNYIKRGSIGLFPMYTKLLFAFYAIWLVISLFTRKFSVESYTNYMNGFTVIAKSNIYIVYCVSFMVVSMGLMAFSRIQVYGTSLLFFMLEAIVLSLYFAIFRKEELMISADIDPNEIYTKPRISFVLLISDFTIVILAFYTMNLLKRGTFTFRPEYEKALLLILGLWFITSLITRKFEKRTFQNYYHAIAPSIKSFILVSAIMSVVIFMFRLFYFSRLHIFGTFFILVLCESFLYYLYFIFNPDRKVDKDIESIEEVDTFLKQEEILIAAEKEDMVSYPPNPVKSRLRETYLRSYPLLFDFIDSTISLSDIDKDHTSVLDTPYIFNIETIEDNSLRLLINVHKLNDIRWFNRYFLQTHKKLINGAYFVGRAETIVTNRIRLFKKYPHYFAEVIYVFHFIIKRILPKLPWIKEIYFFITKGKNRSISRAQVLGRLHFCGFRIVAEKETDDGLYYVAQKSKTPSLDKSPSYGPLIKLERSGYQGRTIQIHKFRTMHPYAEYLQEYVYNLNKLRIGGKIKNDFRLTGWGKFMRRFWLDEIPMLINWLKGEVKFFGVRPLSLQYLELYDSDLRDLRNKVKPGLIPPFYSDLPKNIDEIRLSERRYIQAYLNSPIKTQWIYFWKAVSNIVFKGARSN